MNDDTSEVRTEITFASQADMDKIVEMGFEQGFTMATSTNCWRSNSMRRECSKDIYDGCMSFFIAPARTGFCFLIVNSGIPL